MLLLQGTMEVRLFLSFLRCLSFLFSILLRRRLTRDLAAQLALSLSHLLRIIN
jgi:hypothetical protein